MKFYDREKELSFLKRYDNPGFKFILIKGIRRIGKTRLITEFLKNKKNSVYLFIGKTNTEQTLIDSITRYLNIPRFSHLEDLFDYLFEKYDYIFVDEAQNLYNVKKSIFSYLQRKVDYLDHNNINKYLIFSGSSNSLIRKIFYEYERELYGRINSELFLQEMDIHTIYKVVKDIGITSFEDFLKLWFIFGGVIKFYVDLSLFKPSNFNDVKQNNLLRVNETYNEGKEILISEIGGEYKTYFSLLFAIASGKTIFSELSSVFGNDSKKTARYLAIVKEDFSLLKTTKPIISRLKEKNVKYKIKNAFLNYWFDCVYRYKSLLEQGNKKLYYKKYELRLQRIFGFRFEDFAINVLKNQYPEFIIGRQWGKIPKEFKFETGKDTYEIDICGINENKKEILFGECKWKNRVNADKIVKDLAEKAKYVDWYNGERKETYIVFAKSFSKRIKEFNGKKVYCFDLKDLEKKIK